MNAFEQEQLERNLNPELVAEFTVKGEPKSKARPRFSTRNGKVVAYTPKSTKTAEEKYAAEYLKATRKKSNDGDSAFRVIVRFCSSTYHRRDIDNMIKALLDGLNGVAWVDDAQVTQVLAEKHYVAKGAARTQVEIYRLGLQRENSRPCPGCSKPVRYYPSTEHQEFYCSEDCSQRSREDKFLRICEFCGEGFRAQKSTSQAKYCSMQCKSEAGRSDVECAICSELFSIQKCHIKERNYCSDECRKEQERQNARKRRSKYFPGTCRVCGGGTTRKEYTRCNTCRLANASVGAPKKVS